LTPPRPRPTDHHLDDDLRGVDEARRHGGTAGRGQFDCNPAGESPDLEVRPPSNIRRRTGRGMDDRCSDGRCRSLDRAPCGLPMRRGVVWW
jgi:hypothetical protein